MLEGKHDNSKTTFTSSSIKLLKVTQSTSSLNLNSWIWKRLMHHLTTNELNIGSKYKQIQQGQWNQQ